VEGSRWFAVSGTARGPAPAVFFRDDVAAMLSADARRADLLAIVTGPEADAEQVADRVRAALHDSHVRALTGAKRGEAESPGDVVSRDDFVAGLTVFGVLAAFIAIFVVASTFALSVQQRHRELALFRAIGATPRQVRRMVAAEALLLAVVAFVVAAPLGVVATFLERGLFSRAGIVSAGLHVVVGPLPLVLGLVGAVVTTQLAAFASARRAARIHPTEALRDAAVQRRVVSWPRALAGLALLAAGIAAVRVLDADDAPAGTMILMLAAALLGPLIALPFVWLLGLPLSALSRGPGMLARANTRANLRRAAAVATPVMLAVSLVCTLYFGKTALQKQLTEQTDARTTADYVLRAQDGDGLPGAVARAVQRVPGVRDASGTLATSVVLTDDPGSLKSVPARGVDPATLRGVLDLGVTSGSLGDVRGDGVAVSTTLGPRVGDRIALLLGDGTPASPRVVATFTRPLGFGDVLLPRTLVERHVSDSLDDEVFVAADGGRLDTLRATYPTLEVLTRAEYRHGLAEAARKQSLAAYVLLAVIGVFCALALVNALAMATAERSREFALLRLVGATKSQIRTMIRAETSIMVAIGLTVGSLVALPGLAIFSRSVSGSAMPSVSLPLYGALLGVYAVVGFAATVLPTRFALRMDPVKAMAARE
jgi:putative ABC transport system permease protein